MLLQFPKYKQIDAIDFDTSDAPSADINDPAGATVFLKRFCAPDSIVAVTAIEPDTREINTKSAKHENITAKLDPFIKRHNGKRNLYFSVNPVKRLVTKKAEKADIASLSWLHVDVDPRTGQDLKAERNRIRAQLVGFDPKPNVVIDSGGGYQAFGRLRVPPPVVDGNYAELERPNVALRDHFGADSCQNIDRIMRLPGTYNLPDERKRAKGRTEAVTSIVHMDAGCYDPQQVIESAASAPLAIDGVPSVSVEMLGVSERIKKLIREGHDTKRYDSSSEAVFAVIMALIKAGESDATITAVCLNPDNGISAKMVEMEPAAAIKYVLGDIKRAREKVGGLFDEYVYAVRPKFFVKLATMAELDKESLDAELAVQYPLGQRTPTASKVR